MKLDGYNPAVIIGKEIRESTHAGKDYEKALQTIIRGDPKHSIRFGSDLFSHSLFDAHRYQSKGEGKVYLC